MYVYIYLCTHLYKNMNIYEEFASDRPGWPCRPKGINVNSSQPWKPTRIEVYFSMVDKAHQRAEFL